MPAGLRSGRPVRSLLLASLMTSALATAQTPPKPTAREVPATRVNELTLAGLRPARDRVASAIAKYKRPLDAKVGESFLIWNDNCRHCILSIDFDTRGRIQVIRATAAPWLNADCSVRAPSPWKTRHGLRLGDTAAKILQLYGEPDSRSPSTKDGQPLELWYYAFDWAGPDVPQVMEVLCTKEKDGQPGYVVEITLAAPSL
jgi:hypothetical protein